MIGFLFVAAIALFLLKVFGVITVSWAVVSIPLMIIVIIALIIVAFLGVGAAAIFHKKK